jgi:hypothetical protein
LFFQKTPNSQKKKKKKKKKKAGLGVQQAMGLVAVNVLK